MEAARGTGILAAAVLVACAGGGDAASGAELGEAPDRAFSCYDTGTSTLEAVDLSDPNVAAWVERVNGHHDATLVWTWSYLTRSAVGFEERASVSLDMRVLGAKDLHFVPNPGSPCGESRLRSLDVEVQLGTSDGALSGMFRHDFYYGPAEDGTPTLDTTGVGMNQFAVLPLESFLGTFALGLDPVFGLDPESVSAELHLFVAVDAGGVRGALQPYLWLPPDATGYQPYWAPVEASFPDTCREGDALGDVWSVLGEARRSQYEGFASRWPSAPVTARYTADRIPTGVETQVELSMGPITRACGTSAEGTEIFSPLRVSTADGLVRFEQDMSIELYADGTTRAVASSLRIPASEFERVTGVQGVDFGTATHGQVSFLYDFGTDVESASGGFDVILTGLNGWSDASSPGLSWCAGPLCNR